MARGPGDLALLPPGEQHTPHGGDCPYLSLSDPEAASVEQGLEKSQGSASGPGCAGTGATGPCVESLASCATQSP